MRLRSKTASVLSKYFSPKSQRRYHQIQSNLGYRTLLFSTKSVFDQKNRDSYVSDFEHNSDHDQIKRMQTD